MVAIISYLLLRFYLMRLRMQKGGELDEAERAAAVARVERIVNVIDRILILWFKFLLWLAIILLAMTVVALAISLLSTAPDSAWVASIERWGVEFIAELVGEYGVVTSLSALALSLGIGAISVYLILRLFFRKKRK